ncbi:MAG TPA: LysE family transporter [Phycisphaerae bacterium]|nr:LysE family transporter [Phycisphaerae bacterium]
MDDWLVILGFLAQATVISLTGVMAPGPMTAATIAAGVRRRHAGALIAIGHAVVELPLMVLIVAGVGKLLKYPGVQIGIGLAGGAFLLLMGVQIIIGLRKGGEAAGRSTRRHPLVTGIVLTGGNPYFLLWWATVGLALATQARALGILAFALFAVIHWLCDLVWLEALSVATHRGSRLLGGRGQRVFLGICAAAILFFGAKFILDAAIAAARTWR